MVWNSTRADGEILTAAEWDEVISEISTGRVAGQSTDFVSGTSTQFTLWGSSTDYAPITGSTNYAGNHGLESTFHTALADTTLFDLSSDIHGFCPKGTTYSTQFLTSTGGWTALSSAHINNMSSSGSGLAPVGTTYSTQFLTSTGGWIALSTVNINTVSSDVGGLVPVGTTYSTTFLSSTGGWIVPTINLNKTVMLYAGNSMLATTTYATLAQNLTTANTINWIAGKFTTVAGERLQWGVQMDQGWNSSNLYATFNWTPEKTTETGNAVWELSAIRIGDGSTLHNAIASVITSTDACVGGSSTGYILQRSAETTNFLVTGTGNYITFDVTRKVASDTLTTEINLLSVEIRGTYASTY